MSKLENTEWLREEIPCSGNDIYLSIKKKSVYGLGVGQYGNSLYFPLGFLFLMFKFKQICLYVSFQKHLIYR